MVRVLIAGLVAMVIAVALGPQFIEWLRRAGVVVVWIFNLWGTFDLLNAFYQANRGGLVPGQLGAMYFVPTVIVPLLLITHGLVFRILLQRQSEHSIRESRLPA